MATWVSEFVDGELTCPVLVAHQMSAPSAFVLLWDCGNAFALSTFPQARRGAEPIAEAAEVAATLARADVAATDIAAREIVACMAADCVLALALGWPVAVPRSGP